MEGPAILNRAGVQVAFYGPGASRRASPIGRLGGEPVLNSAWAFRNGVPEVDALRMATLNAAEMLDMDDRIGSIEPGMDADFVILEGHSLRLPGGAGVGVCRRQAGGGRRLTGAVCTHEVWWKPPGETGREHRRGPLVARPAVAYRPCSDVGVGGATSSALTAAEHPTATTGDATDDWMDARNDRSRSPCHHGSIRRGLATSGPVGDDQPVPFRSTDGASCPREGNGAPRARWRSRWTETSGSRSGAGRTPASARTWIPSSSSTRRGTCCGASAGADDRVAARHRRGP